MIKDPTRLNVGVGEMAGKGKAIARFGVLDITLSKVSIQN